MALGLWGPSLPQGQAGLHPRSPSTSGPQGPAHTAGGAAGAGTRALSSCTRGLCKSPRPETPLRAAASPVSGALLDPAGPLTFPARVLCPHPPEAPT